MSKKYYCPECDDMTRGGRVFVSPDITSDSPWSGVLDIFICNRCHYSIPMHLARLGKMHNMGIRDRIISKQQAREQWLEIYKTDASRGKFI